MRDRDELAFQKAIASEPEDDTARLVFADFLDDRGEDGDLEMATFIRAEVELARTDEGPRLPRTARGGAPVGRLHAQGHPRSQGRRSGLARPVGDRPDRQLALTGG
jgi:uncharacterized protein (TIGR02996 family)